MNKKWITRVSLSIVAALGISCTLGEFADAKANQPQYEQKTPSESFTKNDAELYQGALDLGLTDNDIFKIDSLFDKEDKATVHNAFVVVMSIITGIAAVIGTGYGAGRYIAKQLYKRKQLSKAYYKKHRWKFRAALVPVIGIPGTFGFDDYYMDI
ncbi:hypothetical protein P9F86_05070 [Bacillus altitudinis]|uniref:hypothetical protein n=1 Tax=Bacillus TaxID=1386 RepID=UPI0015A4103E|nr:MULTISPECIES: hypothetical protein [Bacillus]MCY7467810.1 hypothetical protein [Bacillus safensis]MEC1118562.1 hypothetical protein [Bacillus safensis]MEC2038220.1 hypothetical protein [Bacillus altitudinis]MED4562723.1 hypothetical protein [Bacillus altitudinis]NWF42231.1 hypothetical protein [Bacillus sp. 8A6]